MTDVCNRAVLFADLRGSTSMYETLGNTDATTVVTQSVSEIARVVHRHAGHVTKTLGDGLMATFESRVHAVAAAQEMHDALARMGAPDDSNPDDPPTRPVPLMLQVGLAYGEVVQMNGDVFGDAVNVAARLLDHAGDNETLATRDVIDGLEEWEQGRFRSLGHMQLRGRAEPVHVHRLDTGRGSDTSIATAFGDIGYPASNEPEGIRLVWLDLNRIYAGSSLPVVLGRSAQATYIIDDSRVSRSHARIDWHGGTFQLVDLSYNGTYVRFDNDPEVISLRRGACTLHGSGVIGLGAPPTEAMSPCVRFEVMKFSDTQRQAPFEFGVGS